MDFKIGDKVTIIEEGDDFGKKTTVIGFMHEHIFPVTLDKRSDSLDNRQYKYEHIIPSRVRYTELAKKMYPKGKKEGDWWLL